MKVVICKKKKKHSEDLTRAFISYITGSPMTQAVLIEFAVAFFLSGSRQ